MSTSIRLRARSSADVRGNQSALSRMIKPPGRSASTADDDHVEPVGPADGIDVVVGIAGEQHLAIRGDDSTHPFEPFPLVLHADDPLGDRTPEQRRIASAVLENRSIPKIELAKILNRRI